MKTFSTPLQNIILDDDDFLQITSNDPMHMPKFDLDFNLDEILDQTDFSTQEVSAIAKEIEKVRQLCELLSSNRINCLPCSVCSSLYDI